MRGFRQCRHSGGVHDLSPQHTPETVRMSIVDVDKSLFCYMSMSSLLLLSVTHVIAMNEARLTCAIPGGTNPGRAGGNA